MTIPFFAQVLRVSLAISILTVMPAAAAEDPRDKAAVAAVLQSVLEKEKSGLEVPWSSSVTGNAGMIVVERTFFPTPERPCRDYVRSIVTPDGEKTTINGTGCRMTTEDWILDEEPPVTVKPNKPTGTSGKTEIGSSSTKTIDEPTSGKTANAETPKPVKEPAEKAAPPLLEYRVPNSSAI